MPTSPDWSRLASKRQGLVIQAQSQTIVLAIIYAALRATETIAGPERRQAVYERAHAPLVALLESLEVFMLPEAVLEAVAQTKDVLIAAVRSQIPGTATQKQIWIRWRVLCQACQVCSSPDELLAILAPEQP